MNYDPDALRALPRQQLFGVYPALVTDVRDPEGQGRVEIKLPFLAPDAQESARAWARLATMMAGAERGTWFVPDPGDEVLVSFIAGDPRHPVVVGALWNGVDAAPKAMEPSGSNDHRAIVSRQGHQLDFDDSSSDSSVTLSTSQGHTVRLSDAPQAEIVIEHARGAQITIDASGAIEIRATTRATVKAPAGTTLETPKLEVTAGLSKFAGVIQAEMIVVNSVVSSSYTPGAGNVW